MPSRYSTRLIENKQTNETPTILRLRSPTLLKLFEPKMCYTLMPLSSHLISSHLIISSYRRTRPLRTPSPLSRYIISPLSCYTLSSLPSLVTPSPPILVTPSLPSRDSPIYLSSKFVLYPFSLLHLVFPFSPLFLAFLSFLPLFHPSAPSPFSVLCYLSPLLDCYTSLFLASFS